MDPLHNLLLGYLTPSPTLFSLVDLPQFPLVDIKPIPMDHHEQGPLGHVLGGAQNGQHRVDRGVDDYDRASNAGEVEAQLLTMRNYMNPTWQMPILAIVLPVHHITLNLKPGMLQALPQFHDCESKRPYTHLKDFEDACSIF